MRSGPKTEAEVPRPTDIAAEPLKLPKLESARTGNPVGDRVAQDLSIKVSTLHRTLTRFAEHRGVDEYKAAALVLDQAKRLNEQLLGSGAAKSTLIAQASDLTKALTTHDKALKTAFGPATPTNEFSSLRMPPARSAS